MLKVKPMYKAQRPLPGRATPIGPWVTCCLTRGWRSYWPRSPYKRWSQWMNTCLSCLINIQSKILFECVVVRHKYCWLHLAIWASSWDYGTYHIGSSAVSPEPLLFAHMKYGSRRRVQPKIRHLAPLDGCTCAYEEWVYGGRKVP